MILNDASINPAPRSIHRLFHRPHPIYIPKPASAVLPLPLGQFRYLAGGGDGSAPAPDEELGGLVDTSLSGGRRRTGWKRGWARR